MAIIDNNQVVTVKWLEDEGYTIKTAYTASTTLCPTYEELNGGAVSDDISVQSTSYVTGEAYTNPQLVVQHDIYQSCGEGSLTLSTYSLEWTYEEVTGTTDKTVTVTKENCITAVTATSDNENLCTVSYDDDSTITITPVGSTVGETTIVVFYEWTGGSGLKTVSCVFNDSTCDAEISADTTYITWAYTDVTAQTVSSSTLTLPTCVTSTPTITVADGTLCTASYDESNKKIDITPAGESHFGETVVTAKFTYGIAMETSINIYCNFQECAACEIVLAEETINSDKTVAITASCVDNTKKFTVTYIDNTTEDVPYDSNAAITASDMRKLSKQPYYDYIKDFTIYPVVKELNGAFKWCDNLTNITIPNSVKIINTSFTMCDGLTSATIPNDTVILNAFGGCENLKRINSSVNGVFNIPKTVKSDDDYKRTLQFFDDYALKSVNIPSGVTYLYHTRENQGSFEYCSGLTSVTFDSNSQCTNLSGFKGCKSLISFTIPNSVTSIDEYAFNNCISLTGITIPNSVTSIGNNAFSNCTSLSSVTIGTSVTSIGKYAFYECKKLKSITIPNNVTSIDDYAFYWDTSLTGVTIGTGITNIGFGALTYCDNVIINATTPPTIDRYAFPQSSGTIYVPAGSVNTYKNAGGEWSKYTNKIQAIS